MVQVENTESLFAKSTSTLAHHVMSGLMVLELRHFEGEDVNEYVFVLRNVLKFLNYGHPTILRRPYVSFSEEESF